MILTIEALNSIEYVTRLMYPNEMCGIITNNGEFKQITNVSENPMKSFELHPMEFYKEKDNFVAIVHSHTSTRYLHICTPSRLDWTTQQIWNIPFFISGFDGFVYTSPIKFPLERQDDYIGRPYIYGIFDCGTLAKDFYWFNFSISIEIDPIMSLTPKNLWANTISTLLMSNNFIEVSGAKQKGDLLLVNVFGDFNNHVIIYLDEDWVLNQNITSAYEPYSDWENKINKIYRHESLC